MSGRYFVSQKISEDKQIHSFHKLPLINAYSVQKNILVPCGAETEIWGIEVMLSVIRGERIWVTKSNRPNALQEASYSCQALGASAIQRWHQGWSWRDKCDSRRRGGTFEAERQPETFSGNREQSGETGRLGVWGNMVADKYKNGGGHPKTRLYLLKFLYLCLHV